MDFCCLPLQDRSFAASRLLGLLGLLFVLTAFGSGPAGYGQQLRATAEPPFATLPDAPGAQTAPQSSPGTPVSPGTPAPVQTNDPYAVSANGTQQTKRILGVVPNFRSVSADVTLPPQSAKDKFLAAGHDSFDYGSFVLAAVQSGFSFDSNSYPEFHHGVVGYGRYYWHTLADTADENFMVGGVGPVLFHQDARFYTLGHGSIGHRAIYAATRVLITRTDAGNESFNFSEVVGSGAASGISTLYYPTKYRTWTKIGQKWLTSDLIDGANFTFKEFWPDINKELSSKFGHRHATSQPQP